MVLGLDISTSCTGYCLWDKDKKEIIEKGFFKLSSKDELFERFNTLKEGLDELITRYPIETITQVNVEDFLMKFAMGRSTASVINKLIAFNSITCYYLWDKGMTIRRHNVLSARKKLFGVAKNKLYKNSKEFVMDMLKKKLGQKYIDSLPLNTKGNIAAEAGDINDAVVMAMQ